MPASHTLRSLRARLLAAAVIVGVTAPAALADQSGPLDDVVPPGPSSRMPVVLTGAQLPGWSSPAATGVANPYPSGSSPRYGPLPPGDGVRDAHNGTLVPAEETSVPGAAAVEDVVAYRYENGRWEEIPVQVDEKFPYFLANGHSNFDFYSGTDMELTYEWDAERWRLRGECEVAPDDGMQDPILTLDDDDEVVFMASDAGGPALPTAEGPPGTAGTRQQVVLTDPQRPGWTGFVYLFQRPGGSSFKGQHYVEYRRDANANQFIDRNFFTPGDPEQLGSSNTGYGPNEAGIVCPDGTLASARPSSDRFPRDGVTVTTGSYRWTASGRWMVRGMQVAKPGSPGTYGPDLIDRWKGRAFQQSPDSSISLVGFEDEQVNWEANSALLGERSGPVRAIREVWGADSGTNVTKTETFYRDAITYRYRMRVHPIPSDGLYTSWDYNADVATRYFTSVRRGETESVNAVAIDGVNDDVGNIDGFGSFPAFFDAPDPTLNVPVTLLNWEQVSGAGDGGSLVYVLENKGPTTFTNPAVVPYYRDDMCLDDGTGDNPVPRPWPGESLTGDDSRVRDAYAAMANKPYEEVTCRERQGAWGSHGVHFFATGDTDNALLPVPVNEVDAQQWQFPVPTASPVAVGEPYHLAVRAPVTAVAALQPNTPAPPAATTLSVDAPATVDATDSLTVSAVLRGDGRTLANEDVTLTFQGTSVTVKTDTTGRAATTFGPVTGPAGPQSVDASYAGSTSWAASSGTDTVEVRRETTTVTVALSGDRPLTVTDITLREPDGVLAGQPVKLLVNGAARTTVTTGSDGTASAILQLKKGDVVRAVFDGTTDVAPATAEAKRL